MFDFLKVNYKTISQDDAKKMMDLKKDYYLLDVREKEEYKKGHIKGAQNLSLQKINDVSNIIKDKDVKIFVYCQSGGRSKIASKALDKMGYTNVYNIGGIYTWKYDIEI